MWRVGWFFRYTLPDLLRFIRHIPGYWRLEVWQGYEPAGYSFIIQQYSKVLMHITHGRLSKPTYLAEDIIALADDLACEGCELLERGLCSAYHALGGNGTGTELYHREQKGE